MTDKYNYVHRGRFASTTYDYMKYILKTIGDGKNYIPSFTQTIENSPFDDTSAIWTSTSNFWTPNGVIVYDDIEGDMPQDEQSLLKLHNAGDPRVRYVKYGFDLCSMRGFTIKELISNPLVIAQLDDPKKVDILEERAKGVNPDRAYMLYPEKFLYERNNKTKNINLDWYSSIDSYGACGQCFHIYPGCYFTSRSHGSIFGYLRHSQQLKGGNNDPR